MPGSIRTGRSSLIVPTVPWPPVSEQESLYERAGGMAFFERLVDAFYDGVAGDEVLVRLYPDAPDLSDARHRLTLFLAQYWGGPTTYSEERGHPRLRLRHMRFPIGPAERDRWLHHMSAAVDAVTVDACHPRTTSRCAPPCSATSCRPPSSCATTRACPSRRRGTSLRLAWRRSVPAG